MEPSIREQLLTFVREKYGTEPAFSGIREIDSLVLRHTDTQKVYATISMVERARLGLSGEGQAEILSIRPDSLLLRDILLQKPGFFPGRHAGSGAWVSVLLDGTVEPEEIRSLLEGSFMATASAKTRQALRPPKEWLIPSNPKYYDVVSAFQQHSEINWKQGKGIKTGDTVFLYVGAPISAILYRCKVTETDLPWHSKNTHVRIDALMRIRLTRRYPQEQYTFEELGRTYGIYAVRGPRGVPKKLSDALNRKEK